MKIEKVNIQELISPAYNPREITPEEMEKLKNSITEFGYVDPIIVNEVNNHIVGGNQRYEALKELGYDEVDVVYVHEEDPNREKALNIALNKISGEWDFSKLGEIFEEMKVEGFDVDLTGFEEIEVDVLLPNSNFEIFDDEEYIDDEDLPEDYSEVEGEVPNQSYSVIISFTDKQKANEFIQNLGSDKQMTGNSIVLREEELNLNNE